MPALYRAGEGLSPGGISVQVGVSDQSRVSFGGLCPGGLCPGEGVSVRETPRIETPSCG